MIIKRSGMGNVVLRFLCRVLRAEMRANAGEDCGDVESAQSHVLMNGDSGPLFALLVFLPRQEAVVSANNVALKRPKLGV